MLCAITRGYLRHKWTLGRELEQILLYTLCFRMMLHVSPLDQLNELHLYDGSPSPRNREPQIHDPLTNSCNSCDMYQLMSTISVVTSVYRYVLSVLSAKWSANSHAFSRRLGFTRQETTVPRWITQRTLRRHDELQCLRVGDRHAKSWIRTNCMQCRRVSDRHAKS